VALTAAVVGTLVGGTLVAVGGRGVAVGGAPVAVGGTGVAVGATFVVVGACVAVAGPVVGAAVASIDVSGATGAGAVGVLGTASSGIGTQADSTATSRSIEIAAIPIRLIISLQSLNTR
jgi:hypothetical protein